MALTYHPTQSGMIRHSAGKLRNVGLTAGGAATATIAVYDGYDATGELLAFVSVTANLTSQLTFEGRPFYSGLYVVVAGSPAFTSVEVDPV